jgi:hypothetical protein
VGNGITPSPKFSCAFQLLSCYNDINGIISFIESAMKTKILNLLKQFSAVKFSAQSLINSSMNWNHKYNGHCEVTIRHNAACFTDYLTTPSGKVICDRKVWQFNNDLLEFWHYRHGSYQHIFSFSLPDLKLVANYYCDADCYSAELRLSDDTMMLTIRINSQRKNEELIYSYI